MLNCSIRSGCAGGLSKLLAQTNLLDAVKIAEALSMRPLLVKCYADLSRLYESRGNSQQADEFSKASKRMAESIDNLNRIN